MESNVKVILSIFLAFIISFAIFYFFYEKYRSLSYNELLEKKFFSQNFDLSQKKIILLGSSHVGRYNTTYIENYLVSHGQNYYVYNLALERDRPSIRINTLDDIISMKPTLIIYGISFRDFETIPNVVNPVVQKPESFLPDPERSFDQLLDYSNILKFNFISNSPRIVTLNFMQKFGNMSQTTPIAGTPNTPFYNQVTYNTITIKNETELRQSYQEYFGSYHGILPPVINKDVQALDEIVHKLKQNNIEVVIITNPQSRLYLDHVSESDKQAFVSIIEEISKKYDIPAYYLHEKYSDLNIWTDPDHITILKPAIVVSQDISKIISKELLVTNAVQHN